MLKRSQSRRLIVAVSVVALLGVGVVSLRAQQPAQPTPIPEESIAPPDEEVPIQIEAPPANTPKAAEVEVQQPRVKPEPVAAVTMGGQPVVEPPDANTAPTPEAPKPVRSPTAIIQALDKVTAETMRFAAPIGRKVRYKNLVFTVTACETSGLEDPQPQSAAYMTVESQPRETVGRSPVKQVFKGWMFATSPGLHPLEHPVYDAWLVACSASTPVT